MDSKATGKVGEDFAVDYLKNKGYKILARNWKNKWGEIDVVAKKKKTIVFCEVKTLRQKNGFAAEDEVDWKKKRQLLKMAQIYLSAHKIPLDTPHQIDIIAIEVRPRQILTRSDLVYDIRHFENAIEDTY